MSSRWSCRRRKPAVSPAEMFSAAKHEQFEAEWFESVRAWWHAAGVVEGYTRGRYDQQDGLPVDPDVFDTFERLAKEATANANG